MTHTRSFSPISRQMSEQFVPIIRLKIFEKWPEWSTISPMPSSTRACTRSTSSSGTSPMRHVPPPEQHIGVVQHFIGQAVGRVIQRDGAHGEVGVRLQPLGDRAVDPLRVDRGDLGVLLFMAPLVPDGDTDWVGHGKRLLCRDECGLA